MRRAKRAPVWTVRTLRAALCCATAAWLGACARPAPPSPPAPAVGEVPAPPSAACERIERIVVRKSERVLVAACAGGGELRLPVALARVAGPKRARGDQRMPEGEYRIAGPPRRSRFYRFLPIDYPAPADAARGLAEGRISPAEHDAIARAHRARRMPSQATALGGHLGFHGEGARWRGAGALDWTEGCIALRDGDVERLGRLAPIGTPVRIEP